MRRYYRRLALKRIIFCLVYTVLVYLLISYCGDRYSITTSNITTVKTIESSRMKSRIITEDIRNGNLKYVYKNVPYNVSCLESSKKIKDNKYNDSTYGEVYILRTNSTFLCESILRIYNDNKEIYGIVLDKSENQSKEDIEILTSITSSNDIEEVNYTIERYGS